MSVLRISVVELDLVSGLFTALTSYDSKWEYGSSFWQKNNRNLENHGHASLLRTKQWLLLEKLYSEQSADIVSL